MRLSSILEEVGFCPLPILWCKLAFRKIENPHQMCILSRLETSYFGVFSKERLNSILLREGDWYTEPYSWKFNPNRPGLFGQLNTQGWGWNLPILGNIVPFSFQTNKQYFIWKLTYSAKIWYPIEVSEVEIAASRGRRSGKGPGEKKFHQKFWNLQFLSYTNIINLKRKLRTISIQIWNKIRGFCYEKVEKKIGFVIFNPKKS